MRDSNAWIRGALAAVQMLLLAVLAAAELALIAHSVTTVIAGIV